MIAKKYSPLTSTAYEVLTVVANGRTLETFRNAVEACYTTSWNFSAANASFTGRRGDFDKIY